MKVLMPIDGSKYSRRMLSYIAAHDELLGSGHEYLLFTVVPRLSARPAAFIGREVLDAHYREEAQALQRNALAFARKQGWAVHSAHAAGNPAEQIAAFAEATRPDLIVMGTHGRTALANVVLGSVASGVLARCRLPLLFIR